MYFQFQLDPEWLFSPELWSEHVQISARTHNVTQSFEVVIGEVRAIVICNQYLPNKRKT